MYNYTSAMVKSEIILPSMTIKEDSKTPYSDATQVKMIFASFCMRS